MKNALFAFLLTLASTATYAQITQQDIARMSKMSPAELEKYKEQLLKKSAARVKQLSAAYNIPVDATMLPDYQVKAPVKDVKRLSGLSLQAPSLMEMSAHVKKTRQHLLTLATPAVAREVEKVAAAHTPAETESLAMGQWMNNDPVQAMLFAMNAALRSPEEATAWNNLAALYNMTGLEQRAVPILRYWLEKMPDNAMLLNNLGQAYLGMGDIAKASDYLQQSLRADPMNPEANHSMGMIAIFSRDIDKAMACFEKELEVAYRRSTVAQIPRMGRTVNLLPIWKRRQNIPHQDLFTDIGLSKFHIPSLPLTAKEGVAWRAKVDAMMNSLQKEFFFWQTAGDTSAATRAREGRRAPGLYADLADKLLSEHGDNYSHLLGLVRGDGDVQALTEMFNTYQVNMAAAICPTPPSRPGITAAEIEAYAKKCCDMHLPLVDAYMTTRNGFIQQRLDIGIANWKSYINGLVDIARLDPTEGIKIMVYRSVAEYFGFLISTVNSGVALEPVPGECRVEMSAEEAEQIIEASHNLQWNCPSWLNIKLDLSMLQFGADCSKYTIEGGEGLIAGYEKNFTTGVSTLAVGAGVKANFGMAKADATQLVYISFDNNQQMTDIGLRGAAGGSVGVSAENLIMEGIGKVSSKVAGVEAGYTLGLESGFKAGLTGKGVMKDFIKLETSYQF